jgi:F-type H+-transporting ATPase subunit delta
MLSAVGSRYARALVDIVMAPGSGVKPADALAQLRSMEQLLKDSGDLRAALLTPAIPTSRKRAVIGKLADSLGCARIIRNFFFVLLDHKRMAQLSEIREAFDLLIDEQMGFVRAEVISAEPLDDRQSAALQEELTKLSGKQIRPHFVVDPSLLGGVLARVGSTVYDGSIRGQIDSMRRQFTKEAVEYKVGL